MSNIKLATQYIATAAAGIAASPAWTSLGVTQFPVFLLLLNSNSNATLEFSLNGLTPFIFMQAGTAANPASISLNLKMMDLVIPENVTLFARRINAGVVGNLRVTLIGSSSSIAP